MNTSVVALSLDHERGLTLKLYERGCHLLEQCMSFDETKYWDNVADAATAWGKIHKSDRVEQLARALKLRAFRRLGELAGIERPPRPNLPREGKRTRAPIGRPPGPVKWLEDRGLERNEAMSARVLAKMPADEFVELTERARPPMPTAIRRDKVSPWRNFYARAHMSQVVKYTSELSPRDAAGLQGLIDRDKLRGNARHLSKWFAEFADALEATP